MIKADKYYIENLNDILLQNNIDENPRPSYKDGTKAHTKFITQVFEKYDISKGEFPITTLRNTAIKTGIKEILWIYQKQTSSLKDARELGVNWWDNWDIGDDTIGQRYGATVKRWNLMDKLLNNLETNPFGRRHIMDLWQEQDISEKGGLDSCAFMTMWTPRKVDGVMYLDMTLTQRSQDAIMATYINKTQYVALQMMVCKHLGFEIGVFSHMVQNYHIYDRHIDACNELLARDPLDFQPTMKLNVPNRTNFYTIKMEDFEIVTSKDIKKIESELEIAI